MKIGFTGHRNRLAQPYLLEELRLEFPNAVWGHGNAQNGFDKQVDNYTLSSRIPCVRFPPRQEVIAAKGYVKALLERNIELVDWLDPFDLLIALYDGRTEGGTFYTTNYARSKKLTITEWKP